MNRGSVWQKWDLHIHTPASFHWNEAQKLRDVTDPAARSALLKRVVDGLNDSGCAAVAIMDYWTFDGVKALRQYLAEPGANSLKPTLFPGIELRVVSPGDFRLNMHVLLHPRLSSEKLDIFKSQLRLSPREKPLSDDYLKEYARLDITEGRLAELKFTREQVSTDDQAALMVASMVAEITPQSLKAALATFGPEEAILFVPFDTNDGLREINFRQHNGYPRDFLQWEAIFEVSNLASRDAFVGIKTNANKQFFDDFQSVIKHPKLAVRGSDAHRIADYGKFPGDKVTWIKAAPTFEGLLQACKEPANRSFIGTKPPKVEFIAQNPHLFIDKIELRKVDGAREAAPWFADQQVALNPDLVALIGRKGSGKSALADILGWMGNTPIDRYFSFLHETRFKFSKDNKAKSFEGRLVWNSDTTPASWRSLDSPREPSVARVRYLPQRYFEELCNDHVKGDDQLLQDELQAVIFSHISQSARQGMTSFGALIARRTENIEAELERLRSELKGVNHAILTLSEEVSAESRRKLVERVRLATAQLRALRGTEPPKPEAPKAGGEDEMRKAEALTALNARIEELRRSQLDVQNALEEHKQRGQRLADIEKQAQSLERHVEQERNTLASKLSDIGIELPGVIEFKLKSDLLTGAKAKIAEEVTALGQKLDPIAEGSPAAELTQLEEKLSAERSTLEEPLRLYQAALEKRKDWEALWAAAVGADAQDDGFRSLWNRLKAFKTQREALTRAKTARQELAAKILQQLLEKASVLKSFYEPVQKLLDEAPEIATRLGVQFSLRISFDDLLLNVFDYLKQNTGALYGQAESAKTVKELLDKHDLTDPAGLAAFLSAFEALLGKEPHELGALLRTAKHPQEFLDFLYGLTYADLKYGLLLKGVELERLSPGQRGALLLIFYLLVDQDRAPIILDQPEENLDNETVYNLLVTVIHRARSTRQVILVTHNANLAVACDAEQIIVCGLEATPVGPRITYTSGAIEEESIRKAVVDILEGTQPAFDNRRRKYSKGSL